MCYTLYVWEVILSHSVHDMQQQYLLGIHGLHYGTNAGIRCARQFFPFSYGMYDYLRDERPRCAVWCTTVYESVHTVTILVCVDCAVSFCSSVGDPMCLNRLQPKNAFILLLDSAPKGTLYC